MSDYVDFHKQPAAPKKELADHEVFNNALMRAQAAGEKPSAELFARIDSEYKKKKEKKAELMPLRSPLQPAIIGALAGTIGGGMRAPKGKLLKYMLGGAAGGGAIGGAMGLGGNFGAIAGDAISRGAGMDEKGTASAATQIGGRLAGLAGGAYLGLKAHNRIGEELEHEDEPKKKEKSAMSLHSFGAKLAQVTGMTYDPDNANVKRLKARHPDNWQQIMAQSQGLSDATQAKVIKKAQSACSPCAMPNAPTNKKPYTSASPAVTDASQKSEEIGKPPVTETEHSDAKAKLPEEGAKSAFAFGAKVADALGDSLFNNLSPADQQATMQPTPTGPSASESMFQASRNMLPPIKSLPNPRYATENVDAGVPGAVAAFGAQQAAKFPSPDMRPKPPAPVPAPVRGYGGFGAMLGTPNVNFDSSGPQLASSTKKVTPSPAATAKPTKPITSLLSQRVDALGAPPSPVAKPTPAGPVQGPAAPGFDDKYEQMITGVTNPKYLENKTDWAKTTKPVQTSLTRGEDPFGDKPKSDMFGDAMGFLDRNKYPIGAGLGAAGLAALLYHMNQPKKKKRDDDEE